MAVVVAVGPVGSVVVQAVATVAVWAAMVMGRVAVRAVEAARSMKYTQRKKAKHICQRRGGREVQV